MKIAILSGSRADLGLLHFPALRLKEAGFEVTELQCWNLNFAEAFAHVDTFIGAFDLLLVLGDRFEILAAAIAAHLRRVPIAHIAGGDVSEGSYDDAMRDCISRMASIHFTTSTAATARLVSLGYRHVNFVGNPAVDYIMHADWKRTRPIVEPYVVVAYYPETIDDTVDLEAVDKAIAGRKAVWIRPNKDRGADRIPAEHEYSHDAFLTLLYYCDEFIGNSSAMFYEAPWLRLGGVPCKVIGKRQRGRVIPWGGEGKASERIVDALKRWNP